VLTNDVVYSEYKDLSDLPDIVVERLKHYFLTYKDMPGKASHTEISHIYGVEEALEVIECSMQDYQKWFENLGRIF
jgi:inorganic pyrophosphatase